MKLKSIAAAIALSVVSVNANAAFSNDNFLGGVGSGDGSGSAVLTVLNTDGASQTSISIDLGLTMSDFLNNNVAANTDVLGGAEEAALVNFLNGSNGAISWDVVGVVNNGNGDLGFLTTTSGPTGFFDETVVASNVVNQASWFDSVANNAIGNVSSFSDATLPGGAADANHNINFVSQAGALGVELAFDAFLRGFGPINGDGSAFNALANTFTLSTDGTALTYNASSAVIPLPAAAWVFISAVLGLAGVARRRTSVSAAAA